MDIQNKMSHQAPYYSRTGREELFISAPNDAVHIYAFQMVIPDAVYDNILEEWRTPWKEGDINSILVKLHEVAADKSKSEVQRSSLPNSGKVYGYAQVSDEEGAESQIDTLRNYDIQDENIFLEKLGPRNSSRPILEQCLSTITQGDTLVVSNLNRVGRSLKQFVITLRDIEEKGAFIKSLDEGIDTSNPYYSKFIEFVGYAADFEQKAVGIRTKAGLKAAAKIGGRRGGRKRSITTETIKMIATLVVNGMALTEVAQLVGTSRAAIYRNIPGGPKAILDAFHLGGQPAVDAFIESISVKLPSTQAEKLKDKVLYLYNVKKESIQEISNRTGLNIKTARQYIQDSDQ